MKNCSKDCSRTNESQPSNSHIIRMIVTRTGETHDMIFLKLSCQNSEKCPKCGGEEIVYRYSTGIYRLSLLSGLRCTAG
jgi:hypothetical protein